MAARRKTPGNRPIVERLHFIVKELRSFNRLTCPLVAGHFECSTKSVLRDIEFLRDRMGYEIEWIREEHSYQLLNNPEPVL